MSKKSPIIIIDECIQAQISDRVVSKSRNVWVNKEDTGYVREAIVVECGYAGIYAEVCLVDNPGNQATERTLITVEANQSERNGRKVAFPLIPEEDAVHPHAPPPRKRLNWGKRAVALSSLIIALVAVAKLLIKLDLI